MEGKVISGSIRLILKKESREIEVPINEGHTLVQVLREADLPLDGVLVFDNGRPIPLDAPAQEFDVLTVINVSSGG